MASKNTAKKVVKMLASKPVGMSAAKWAWDERNPNGIRRHTVTAAVTGKAGKTTKSPTLTVAKAVKATTAKETPMPLNTAGVFGGGIGGKSGH